MSISEEKTDRVEAEQNYETIDLTVIVQDCLRILHKHWVWLVLAIVLGAAGLALVRYQRYVPLYTAQSTYVITASPDGKGRGYYDDQLATQMSKTFPYILTSDILRGRIAQELGTDYVPGTIRATVMEGTNFLTISVTDRDPQRAYQTLQAVLDTAPALTEEIAGKIYMELMDESGVPAGPDNARNIRGDAVQGAIAGGVVGLAILVLLALTSRTVRREEDCLRRINTPCMGVVPRVRFKVRSKKREQYVNICRKNAEEDVIEAFRIIRNRLERRSMQEHVKTVLVTSTLPGEGKSTVAANLAVSLAQTGKKVALVDCDLRNPSDAIILETPEGAGLVDFLQGKAKFAECVISGQTVTENGTGLLFVRGGKSVRDASAYLGSDRMKQLIHMLESQMDYVILDAAPVGLLTDAGILAQYAGGAIFVVRQDYTKVDRILEAMEQLTESRCRILGCVLNGEN